MYHHEIYLTFSSVGKKSSETDIISSVLTNGSKESVSFIGFHDNEDTAGRNLIYINLISFSILNSIIFKSLYTFFFDICNIWVSGYQHISTKIGEYIEYIKRIICFQF